MTVDLVTWLEQVLPVPHTVTVEAHAGSGPYGDVYGLPYTVTCFVDQKRKLVRASDGSQIVSESTVYAPLGTICPPRSRVTLPDGQVTLVIAAHRREAAGVAEAPEHLEIVCE